MSATETTQRWIWRNLQIDLPRDWEMLQFSREEKQGRCAFADARQFRLELSWAVVPKAPDLERLMSDYKSKLEKNRTITDGFPAKIAGWHGLTGQQKDQPMSRFGFYHEAGHLLTEMVFLWNGERDRKIESSILHSCMLLVPRDNEPIRWRAFGMDMLVPGGFAMTTCQIQPACAQIIFTHPKRKPEQFRFQRLGMVKNWLDRPMEAWMRQQAPARLFDAALHTLPNAGIDVTVMNGVFKPKEAFRHQGCYEAACWIEPSDGRLFFIEAITREKAPSRHVLLSRLQAMGPV